MNWKWLVGYVIGVFVACFILAAVFGKKEDKPVEWKDLKVYYMRYGGMPCAEIEFHECGVTLKKCTDAREYYCVHDVAVEAPSK